MGLFSSTPSTYSAGVKSDIDAAIKNHSLLVFSATYCPYCRRTKELLRPFSPYVIEVDSLGSDVMAEYKMYLSEVTNASRITWPRVFIGGKLIGGCDDTTNLHNQGKLESLIESARGASESPSKL